jgi:uroporphyrin-3 C-methyltransferase
MSDPETAAPRRLRMARSAATGWLMLAGVVLLLAVLAWLLRPTREAEPVAAAAADPLARALSTEVQSLRAQLDDAQGVNRVLREQMLALTRRVGLMEDAVAGLGSRTLPVGDQLALDEATFLLSMAVERYTLFGDANGALRAFDLADGQLSTVADPRIAPVRQNLAIERELLRRVAPLDMGAVAAQLASLTERLEQLPRRSDGVESGRPRLKAIIERYLVVRPRDALGPRGYASATVARQRVAVDLAAARLALLHRDQARFREAIAFAIASVELNFEPGHPQVLATLEELRALEGREIRPTVDGLGLALEELRRYRAARGLPLAAPSEPPGTGSGDLPGELPGDMPADAPIEPPAEAPDAGEPEVTLPPLPAPEPEVSPAEATPGGTR